MKIIALSDESIELLIRLIDKALNPEPDQVTHETHQSLDSEEIDNLERLKERFLES